MATLRLLFLAVSTVPALAGCANVLGIEAATYDSKVGAGGTSNGAGGNAGSGGGDSRPLCERYCDTVGANCTDTNLQYTSRAVCLKACSRLQPGNPDDNAGNTVNCRLHYAESATAAGEPAGNCSVAGPGGAQLGNADVCGSFCDGLCVLALDTCKGANFRFTSLADCSDACKVLPDLGDYNVSFDSGNSVQCRLYHVSAAQIDPVIHCPHVGGDVGPCKP